MMKFTSPQQASAAAMGLLLPNGGLTDEQREKLLAELSNPVPVESIVMAGEYLYSVRDALSPEAREAAADLIVFRIEGGFWGAWSDDRCSRMVQALNRGGSEDGDPDADPKFAPPELPDGAAAEAAAFGKEA